MLKSKKKALALAVLCAVSSMGFMSYASAEELAEPDSTAQSVSTQADGSGEAVQTHQLAGITVEGDKDVLPGGMLNSSGNIGFLGTQDVMDTPFAVTNINEKAIKTFASPYYGISDALSLSPSVRADRGGTYTDISIRGIYQSGHSFYVNGIPGLLAQENIPYYWVAGASVVSGPNLGINGTSYSEAISGTVNLQSKVAEEEGNAEVKLTYRGGSSFEEGIDVGRRFGKNNEYGLRITANNINGETVIDGENLEQQNLFINFDHKDDNSKTNLLLGYNHTDHEGGPGAISFKSGSVTSLPDAPDSSKLYKPDWTYNEYDNWIAALNHEQKLSEHLSAFLNAGYHREDWYGYIDGNPTVIDNNGDFTIGLTNYPLALTKKYLGIGFKGDFKIGEVKNEYIIGADKNWYTYDIGNNANWSWSGTGNLFKHNSWNNPGLATYNPPHSQDAQMTGWHIVDTLKALDDKLQVTLGLHGHKTNRTPVGSDKQESDAICPTYAVSYKITPDVMAYASHSESFGIGSMVSTDYANAGEILDPAKTKQNEIGVKVKTGNFYNTFNVFEIEQANTVDKWENGKKYLRLDGEQKNKGFEWAISGNIDKKWDLIGGLMYLDAKDNKGDRVNGAARWSGSLGAVYHPDEDISFIGRVTYLGSSTINNGDLDVPAYAKFDLGMSYKTKLNNTPVTIDAMCYNIGGKDYWQARSGSSSLTLGAPRTFVLSATFDI